METTITDAKAQSEDTSTTHDNTKMINSPGNVL